MKTVLLIIWLFAVIFFSSDQAMIGIAFSLGFTVGPLMGAYFAVSSKTTGNVFYETPALLALAFSAADLLFIWLMLPETLSKDVKVSCQLMN